MATAKKTTTDVAIERNLDFPQLGPDDLILEPYLYDEYVPRDVGGLTDLELFDKAREMRHNVLLYGPTGPGKTSAVMAYAAQHKLPFYSIPCNGAMEPRHIIGGVVAIPSNGGVTYEWRDGPGIVVARNNGVLFLDEVNFMHPRIGGFLHPVLDKRRQFQLLDHGGEIVDIGDTLVVAAMNPSYAGTRPLNAAFRNRFAIQVEYTYDREIEESLVEYGILLELGNALRERHANNDIQTPVSTNMLMEFEDFATSIGIPFAMLNFQRHFDGAEQAVVEQVLELWSRRIYDAFGVSFSDDEEDQAEKVYVEKGFTVK